MNALRRVCLRLLWLTVLIGLSLSIYFAAYRWIGFRGVYADGSGEIQGFRSKWQAYFFTPATYLETFFTRKVVDTGWEEE